MKNIDLEHFPNNPIAQRMLTYVTRGWYDNSYVGKWIFEVIGRELETAINRVEETPDQAFPETSSWGIYFHELMYGIPVDRKKDIDERRKEIMNRRDRTMRSSITPYRLESIIKSVFGLSSKVTEQIDKYIINIDLLIGADYPIGQTNELLKYIRKIKPSHLALFASYVIETASCIELEKAVFPSVEIAMQLPLTEYYDLPIVEVKCKVTENASSGITGNVMIYKNLNQWNGRYKWDGTIYFDTEIITEDL